MYRSYQAHAPTAYHLYHHPPRSLQPTAPSVSIPISISPAVAYQAKRRPAVQVPKCITHTKTDNTNTKLGVRKSNIAGKKVRSSRSNVPGESRYWTPSEHKLFVEALLRYGPKNLKEIAAHVGTRNMIQCRTHEQKCFMRLLREAQKETAKRAGDPKAAAKTPKDMYR